MSIVDIKRKQNKSSAVAVIADRTAYDVQYTGKLSNQFWFQVDEIMAGTHDSIQRVEFRVEYPNSIYSSVTIERDRPKFNSS